MSSSASAALTDKDFMGKTQDEIEMMKVMGFAGFDTTKNKKVKRLYEVIGAFYLIN